MFPQHVALELLVETVRRGPLGQELGGPLAVPAPPPPAGRGVDQHPAGVRLDRLDLAQALPGQVGLGQRGLQQVLGGGPVTGQQVGGAQQGSRTGRRRTRGTRPPSPTGRSQRTSHRRRTLGRLTQRVDAPSPRVQASARRSVPGNGDPRMRHLIGTDGILALADQIRQRLPVADGTSAVVGPSSALLFGLAPEPRLDGLPARTSPRRRAGRARSGWAGARPCAAPAPGRPTRARTCRS